MLNAEYETAYISNFTKVFSILKQEYEVMVKPAKSENYEIKINKINDKELKEYLSICFQKQNGSLVIISDKKIDDEIIEKVVHDVKLALNENVLAKYNFVDSSEFDVFHFSYIKDNIIVDNKKLLQQLKNVGQIKNLSFL